MSRTAQRLLSFQLGEERFALPLSVLVAVRALVPLRPLLGTPTWVSGVVAHRGKPLPVIDLCQRTTGRPATRSVSTRILIVDVPCDRTFGKRIGLIVERATDLVVGIAPAEAPGLLQEEQPHLGALLETDRGQVQLVDIRGLLPPDVASLIERSALAEAAHV